MILFRYKFTRYFKLGKGYLFFSSIFWIYIFVIFLLKNGFWTPKNGFLATQSKKDVTDVNEKWQNH